jgi:energy-coupling factor transporter ATP-binding protein EcfA2
MAIIDLEGISYTYPGSTEPVLKDLSLQVEAGQLVAVIGPNEAGKSTLAYLLAGFVPHFFNGSLKGKAEVCGLDVPRAELSEIVTHAGLVFQNPFSQISGAKFSVYEEIAFGLENLGVAREEMAPRLRRAMELTGIEDLADRSPFSLSGGQLQRVALASILVMDPELLILDEPTSQLDPIGSREVFSVVRDLSRQGHTIVLVEHKLEWVAAFADRVILLDGGKIVLDGAPEEVLTSEALSEHGLRRLRYTEVAGRGREVGLWPVERPLPITLEDGAQGLVVQLKER